MNKLNPSSEMIDLEKRIPIKRKNTKTEKTMKPDNSISVNNTNNSNNST